MILSIFTSLLCFSDVVTAFHASPLATAQQVRSTRLSMAQEDLVSVRSYLEENYPSFHKLIDKNEEAWKKLSDGDGYTMFVPVDAAFAKLGDKKLKQLEDIRNVEATNKVGAYHCINEIVTFDELYNSGGIITLGGEIPVDRSTSGGMFGVGGNEDGGVVINGAKITGSMEVGPGTIHEVDGLVVPQIIWRYMDQLRIPGSS
eukprot:CAMPEP_0198136722 /NCGR_PEP_ID=MMETSP1443-20131203/342_1 /TAXON_ID=186043 /ORGANISM="Entomoneis sp., Strain CCMP2396" /LENGTH=201 /DNA_ID=CAMNT_0043797989 /DNA_START=91 /DNA_END=696 /DNA_ORIENTATION=+